MTEEDSNPKAEAKFDSRWLLAVVCAITAAANQYGFWSVFHVAIFEHLGLMDIPRLAVWPLVTVFFTYLIGILPSTYLRPTHTAKPRNAVQLAVWAAFTRHRRLIGILLLAGAFAESIFRRPDSSAPAWPMLLVLALGCLVDRDLVIQSLGVSITPFMIVWSALILGLAYGTGVGNAVGIKEGRSYLKAEFSSQPHADMRYLGRVGDHVFLYDPSKKAASLYELKQLEPLSLIYTTNATSPGHVPPAQGAPPSEPKDLPSAAKPPVQ